VKTQPNDGGPAFPWEDTKDAPGQPLPSSGMTLRDYFAGQVQVPDDMGWVASALMGEQPPHWSSHGDYETSLACAKWWADARARYRLMDADAMLAAREQKEGDQ